MWRRRALIAVYLMALLNAAVFGTDREARVHWGQWASYRSGHSAKAQFSGIFRNPQGGTIENVIICDSSVDKKSFAAMFYRIDIEVADEQANGRSFHILTDNNTRLTYILYQKEWNPSFRTDDSIIDLYSRPYCWCAPSINPMNLETQAAPCRDTINSRVFHNGEFWLVKYYPGSFNMGRFFGGFSEPRCLLSVSLYMISLCKGDFSAGISCVSGYAGNPVGSDQKSSLPYTGHHQASGEYREDRRIKRDGITRSPVPEGFLEFLLWCFFGGVAITVAIFGMATLICREPKDREGEK